MLHSCCGPWQSQQGAAGGPDRTRQASYSRASNDSSMWYSGLLHRRWRTVLLRSSACMQAHAPIACCRTYVRIVCRRVVHAMAEPHESCDNRCVLTALQVLQTSSPSYILLSSLDAARRHAFKPGVWLAPLAAAEAARTQLAALPGLSLLQDKCCGAQQSVSGFDPLRLVMNTQGLGLSGYDAAAWLEQQHGVVPELATNKVSLPEVVGGRSVLHAAKN